MVVAGVGGLDRSAPTHTSSRSARRQRASEQGEVSSPRRVTNTTLPISARHDAKARTGHESAGHIARADGGRRFRIASNDGEENQRSSGKPARCAWSWRACQAARSMQWRTVAPIAQAAGLDDAAADAAIALAVGLDWLLTEGQPPHSICLSDGGRVMVAKQKRR